MIVSGMYIQEGLAQRIKIFGYDTPVMFMSYVGALKSWIYTPIFALWKPSPATLRVPVILISALTIWIFYRWLLRIASRRAALIGCVLLSTDTIFLMTSYFDWGPVVLQHFLSVSGAFFVVRFHQTRQLWFLAAGFFQFGLGMWDKAVFIWILCGMAVAAVVVFPKEVWRCLAPAAWLLQHCPTAWVRRHSSSITCPSPWRLSAPPQPIPPTSFPRNAGMLPAH